LPKPSIKSDQVEPTGVGVGGRRGGIVVLVVVEVVVVVELGGVVVVVELVWFGRPAIWASLLSSGWVS
jgi:hypothetical protein